jgi:hypothetical protein
MTVNEKLTAAIHKRSRLVAVVLVVSFSCLATVNAQFNSGFGGQMDLPKNDFTWTWGNQRNAGRGMDDFSMFGSEGGFSCDLKGKLSINSRMSRMDVRSLESDLRTKMNFIQAAANAMNGLDAQRQLDWATLDCKKPKRSEEEPNNAERESQ